MHTVEAPDYGPIAVGSHAAGPRAISSRLGQSSRQFAAPAAVIGLAVAARLIQYASARSLWLDEAYLALNILERDFAGLLLPLTDDQIAPPGFLYVEKLVVLALGNGEYALRLFPLVGGLLGLLVFYFAVNATFGSTTALIGAALLGWSQPLIYFSSELKPYSTDVLFAIVAYALHLPLLHDPGRPSWRRVVALGLVGAAMVWFSYPSVFVLGAIGTAALLAPMICRDWRRLLTVVPIPLAWAASLAALYFVTLRTPLENEAVRAFWGQFYASFPPRSLSDAYWFAQLFFDFLVQAGGLPFYGLATFAWLAGTVVVWRSGRWQGAMALTLPLGLAMAAAALQRYPFYGRALLFAVPPTLLLVACGAHATYRSLATDSRTLAVLFMGAMLFHPLYRTVVVFGHPLTTEESKPVLQYVRDQWQDGDRLYVYHGAARPFQYYAKRYGFQDERIHRLGRSSNGEFSILTEDIELERGARVWFLFAHVYTFRSISEEAFMVERLDRAAARLDTGRAPGAVVYLYDLR